MQWEIAEQKVFKEITARAMLIAESASLFLAGLASKATVIHRLL